MSGFIRHKVAERMQGIRLCVCVCVCLCVCGGDLQCINLTAQDYDHVSKRGKERETKRGGINNNREREEVRRSK